MRNSKRRNIGKGIGLGAGIVALAGIGGGLILAYKEAKKNDTTIKALISKKANAIKNKKKCSCTEDCIDCDCKCHDATIDDYCEDMDFEDFLNEECNFENEESSDIEIKEIDAPESNNIDYKAEYIKLLNELKQIKENNKKNNGENN